MIKVGQIYKENETNLSFVITREYTNPQGKKKYDWIYNSGMVGDYQSEHQVLSHTTLITEYPTWQEAVNSKEFKTENEE